MRDVRSMRMYTTTVYRECLVPTSDCWFPNYTFTDDHREYAMVFHEDSGEVLESIMYKQGMRYRVGARGMDDTCLVKDFPPEAFDESIALYRKLFMSDDLRMIQCVALGMRYE